MTTSSQNTFDLLVIGGGVIGLSCALHVHVLRPAWRICILDRPTQAGVASTAAAGMLAPFSEFAEDHTLAALARESFAEYPDFLARFAPGVPLCGKGTLLIDGNATEHRFNSRVQALAGLGVEARILRGDALRAAEPSLAPTVPRALHLPERLIDPRALHASLCEAARTRGIAFLDAELNGLKHTGNVVERGMLGGKDDLRFERLLIATGAWSSALGAQLGLSLDVTPIKGQIVQLDAPRAETLRHIIHAPNIYVAQRSANAMLCGATMEDAGFDSHIDADTSAELVARAAALVPDLATARVADSWIGFRPRTPDKFPILGKSSRFENLWLATGHFRNGILLTPATGRVIAASIVEGRPCADEYLPARFRL